MNQRITTLRNNHKRPQTGIKNVQSWQTRISTRLPLSWNYLGTNQPLNWASAWIPSNPLFQFMFLWYTGPGWNMTFLIEKRKGHVIDMKVAETCRSVEIVAGRIQSHGKEIYSPEKERKHATSLLPSLPYLDTVVSRLQYCTPLLSNRGGINNTIPFIPSKISQHLLPHPHISLLPSLFPFPFLITHHQRSNNLPNTPNTPTLKNSWQHK